MTERNDLLQSVAQTIQSYRAGDLVKPTPQHVDRWLRQFTPDAQLDFLREFDHVMKKTFFTETNFVEFLTSLASNDGLSGGDHIQYWHKAHFLDIQRAGNSQTEMLRLFSKILKDKYRLDTKKCGAAGGDYIYVDDVIFSGSRAINDLTPWIREEAPNGSSLKIIVIAVHSGGEFWAKKRLNEIAHEAGKKIDISVWRTVAIEN